MNRQILYIFSVFQFFLLSYTYAQEGSKTDTLSSITELFSTNDILPLKLSFSNKDIKQNTNDSTYIKTDIAYQQEDKTWRMLDIELRARGNYRRANCYFLPVKLKIKKKIAKGTIFEGNKKLKLVLPCLKAKNLNDDLIKEFIAYKLYEIISEYHFKTRLVSVDFTEIKTKKTITHNLLGFLIEDDKNFEKRFDGKELERFVHPLLQDTLTSVQNSFFQYMIANTDYSTAHQHNEKLFLIDNKMIPVPYDFDMSGFVNASYAVVSQIQNEELPITHVTQRIYRGFKRDPEVFQKVRNQFIANQDDMLELIDSYENLFSDPKEFSKAREFILEFYEIILDDRDFNSEIVIEARKK